MSIRTPWILSRYHIKIFFSQIMMIWCIISGLILLIDTLELLRRGSGKAGVSMGILFELALLKLPTMMQTVLPFAILIGCLLALSRLSRTSELVAARAAGISIWQLLNPALLLALGLGLFSVMVFNPVASVMLARFEKLEARYLSGQTSMLSLSGSGLWLRQADSSLPPILNQKRLQAPEVMIHALRADQKDMQLFEAMFLLFDKESRFLMRLDAHNATLKSGYWDLQNVILNRQDSFPLKAASVRLNTNLTTYQIQNSFAPPDALSFWELPAFIHALEQAGFSATRHRLYWHSLLASPVLMLAMILISASFGLRPQRMGKTGMLLAFGVFTGFILYFMTDIIEAFGLSGTLPPPVAAWSPALISLLGGLLTLLHFEDG